jgi:hypothetical protein
VKIIASKSRYFDKLATVQKPIKTFFIFVLSLLFELMIFFEFGTKRFIKATIDQVTPVYNQEINASFHLDEGVKWKINNSKFVATNLEDFDLKTISYHNKTDFQTLINNSQNQALNCLIQEYLSINRNETKDIVRTQILFNLIQLNRFDFNHATLKIKTLESLLPLVENDYQNFFKTETFEPIYLKAKAKLDKIAQQAKSLANPDMYYTFNNVFLQKDVDYSVLRLKLFNNNYQ